MMTIAHKQKFRVKQIFNTLLTESTTVKPVRIPLKSDRVKEFAKHSDDPAPALIKQFVNETAQTPLFNGNDEMNRIITLTLTVGKSPPSLAIRVKGDILKVLEQKLYNGGTAHDGLDIHVSLRSTKWQERREERTERQDIAVTTSFRLSNPENRDEYVQNNVLIQNGLNPNGQTWNADVFMDQWDVTFKINISDFCASNCLFGPASEAHQRLLHSKYLANVRLITRNKDGTKNEHLCHFGFLAAASSKLAADIMQVRVAGEDVITDHSILYSKDAVETMLNILYSGDPRKNLVKSPDLAYEMLALSRDFGFLELEMFLYGFFLDRTPRWFPPAVISKLKSNLPADIDKASDLQKKLLQKLQSIVNQRALFLFSEIGEICM